MAAYTSNRAWFDDRGCRKVLAALHRALLQSCCALGEAIPAAVYPLALPLEFANMCSFAVSGRRLVQSGSAYAVYRLLQRLRRRDTQRLVDFFFLTEPLPVRDVSELLRRIGAPDEAALLNAGLLEELKDRLRSRVRFVSSGDLLIVSDRFDRGIADFTYIGGDSLELAERLRKRVHGRRFKRALDVCCGTGVQGLTVAASADRVDGVDINPRAIDYANLNALLHGVSDRARFSVGDLTQKLEGPYDLIVANPPFLFLPAAEKNRNRDGYGGELGLELVGRIVADLDRLLAPAGEAVIISNSPFIGGECSLAKLVERVLSGTRLGATLEAVQYSVHRDTVSFQRAKNISHVIHYCLYVNRRTSGVQVKELPLVRRVAGATYAKTVNRVYGAISRPA